MAAHIALVMHAPLGSAFAACAQHVLGHTSTMTVVDLPADVAPETAVVQLTQTWMQLPEQDELLVLSDVYGATPFNIAVQALRHLKEAGRVAHLITGTNLCMVLKALTESTQHPQCFAEQVRLGALRGIIDADGACAVAQPCYQHA